MIGLFQLIVSIGSKIAKIYTLLGFVSRFGLNNLWLLIVPATIAFKMLFNFLSINLQKIQSIVSGINAQNIGQYAANNPALGNIYAIGNSIFPLDEIFQFIPVYITLVVACLTIRAVQTVKKTILF